MVRAYFVTRYFLDMTFWIPAFVLIAAVVAFALWPLIRGKRGANALDHAVAFYDARKAELIRQRDTGEITEAQCESALAEQARMVLALSRAEKLARSGDGPDALRRRKFAALLMLVAVPVVSLGIYAGLGRPTLPDMPLTARKASPQTLDIATALQKIEAHLAKNPDDGRGFEIVAPVYLRAGRFADAARAYRRVIELLGETPARLADLGESLVADGNGVVSIDARKAFERSRTLDPDFAKTRFYLTLAREQDGDIAGAYLEFQRIESGLPEGPSRMRVSEEIARLRAEGKVVAPEGGKDDAGRAIAGLPPEDRDAAIRSMVDALDTRLAEKGGGIEDWQRLIQSRIVLGQRDKAEAAMTKARAALGKDAAALAVLDTLQAGIAAMPTSKTP